MQALQNPGSPPPADSTPSLLRTFQTFPRPVWILFVGTFINKFGTFVVPFLALHLTRLGYSPREAGVCLAAYGAGHFIASAVGGHLADTIGRRNTIMLSMFTGTVAILLLSQAASLPLLIALAFLTGLAAEFYKPASSALLADLVPPEQRVTAYAAYRFAINAGWSLGPATAGLLAKHSYFWLFVGDAATCLIFGLVAWLYLPRENRHAPLAIAVITGAYTSVSGAARIAFQDPRFVRLLAATFLAALVFVQMPTTLGIEIKAAGISEWHYGLVLGVNGILIVLFEIPLSTYTRRLPPRRTIATGFALIGLGVGLNGWADRPWEYVFAMGVMTCGEIISFSVAIAYAASLAPESMRGRYLGLYGLTWATALIIGPALGLWGFTLQPEWMWISCGLIGLLSAIVVAGVGKSRPELAVPQSA